MEFNSNIREAFKILDSTFKGEDICSTYLAHYEILKSYAPTYTYLDIHKEPEEPLSIIDWLPSRLGFMLYSTNYRLVPLMEDIVDTINNEHYLSTVVLVRALLEYSANINYYVKRLMIPTGKIVELMEDVNFNKGRDFIAEETSKQLVITRKIVFDFLASSRPNFDSTKRTEMEKWQAKVNYISPSTKTIIKRLSKDFFFDKEPYEDLYHILSNYSHPNSESNRLSVVDYNDTKDGTLMTLSREVKNPGVLASFLSVIYIPILGSIRTISVSLNQLNEIMKFYNHLYKA
jgi:hypothetical protein